MKKTADYYAHPIFDPVKFRIMTPPVITLRDNLMRNVWTGATGGVILGFTRAGKSTALELIEDSLYARDGKKIPMVRYSVHRRDFKKIRSLLENILSSLKFKVGRYDSAEVLTNLLIEYLAECVSEAKTHHLVMTIDEAQRLSISQVDLFAELYDRLRDGFGISLTVFFVGNREQLGRLLKEIMNGENEHIVGRFFKRSYEFHGLRNRREVEACLKQFDQLSHIDNGPSYTEYLLDESYPKGFKLASLSHSMWRVFCEYKKQLKISEWGMEYFSNAVFILLTDYLVNYGVDNYSDEMFEACVEVSGLVPDSIIVATL